MAREVYAWVPDMSGSSWTDVSITCEDDGSFVWAYITGDGEDVEVESHEDSGYEDSIASCYENAAASLRAVGFDTTTDLVGKAFRETAGVVELYDGDEDAEAGPDDCDFGFC